MRVAINPPDLPALILGVNVIGISRVLEHPEAIAVVHVFPLVVGNPAGVL
jgi:hypothetical protein